MTLRTWAAGKRFVSFLSLKEIILRGCKIKQQSSQKRCISVSHNRYDEKSAPNFVDIESLLFWLMTIVKLELFVHCILYCLFLDFICLWIDKTMKNVCTNFRQVCPQNDLFAMTKNIINRKSLDVHLFSSSVHRIKWFEFHLKKY